MNWKTLLSILALTVVACAQTATPAGNSAPPPNTATTSPDTKAQCPCCQKAADGKPEMACAHHQNADASGKDAMPCCDGKDATACMKSRPVESADAAPANRKQCGGDQKDCCGKAGKDSKQAAMACCKGAGGHCSTDHQHDHGEMK